MNQFVLFCKPVISDTFLIYPVSRKLAVSNSRVTADVGKCPVCGIARAVWLDREGGVNLCEHCYGRGLRNEAEESGVV